MLKVLGYMFILQLSVFHTMLINLVFCTSLFTLPLLPCIVLCTRCPSNEALNQLHRARLRKNLEAQQIWVFGKFVLKFSRDRFFIASYHFTVNVQDTL